MPSLKEIRDDVFLQLYQGAPSDDAELPLKQIDYWIEVYLNELVANECNQKLVRREMIPHVYIKKVQCEVSETETDPLDNTRVYVDLPGVLALNGGGGLVRITTDDGTPVNRASVETMNMFNALRFSKPSGDNLIYVHEGDKVYIEGLEPSDEPFDKLNIWYVPKQDILNMTETSDVLVSDLTLPMLIQQVVAIGMHELYGTQQDTANDGADVKDVKYHTAISKPQ